MKIAVMWVVTTCARRLGLPWSCKQRVPPIHW